MWYRKVKKYLVYLSAVVSITFFVTGCVKQQLSPVSPEHPPKKEILKMQVHATAYTSRLKRKNAKYPVGAWGDALTPTCHCIAVSDDLFKMGLTYKTKVRIDGLSGEYVVMDRMHPKWKKRIDVYMGDDFKRARYWGNRMVTIHWAQPKEENVR
ncbi:hypothetical protein PGH07_08275 [Sulfurovum sp. zt1-1]|uniref:3D (Asp-Asp-Asp) domain-containing protein n=1 Tax=Sulfurovum zhangzhouensis TaxID=3019067 RepID=A0ABT7QZA2_9BACT|nr:hypothetical protein [Sulfurovum zhangzhouensis]MDM5272174.1 hypothetical protein [Sulfurovum zhangzhouensis]